MEVKIERIDHHGRGIGYIDGKIIFITNALPSEVVEVKVTNDTAKYMEGEVVSYIEKSPNRVKSKCPYYGECGGCHLRHMSYDDTLEFKKNKVANILKKYNSIEMPIEVVRNKQKDFYRNKVELKVVDGVYGFYKRNTHEIVEIDRCLNAEEEINTILRSTNILNIQNGTIMIKANYNGEIILNIESCDDANIDIERLREKCKLVGILYNKKLIFGADHFIEIINDMFFKETYNSFFQVNRYINSELFKLIEDNVEEGSIVADMCSGVGTLSIVASKKAEKVYSLEIVENAIKDGLLNAKMNRRDNIEFMLGDAYSNLGKIKEKLDTIIIDPPRSGLNKEALKTILDIEPEDVIYVSCDPITLSRDLKVLQHKFDIKKIYILDMFSFTYHVESMIILKRKMEK